MPKLYFNGLDDSLYNVYSLTTKKLWASLDKKNKTEDAGTKKFVVGRFLDYKMVDSKTVINQVQENIYSAVFEILVVSTEVW